MNKIVSSTLVGVAIEAGELFGTTKNELVELLPDPNILNKRWQRLEWDIFVKLMGLALAPAGSGEALLEAGRMYKRERYDLRSAHLYAQFQSWERAFWVSKNLIVKRLLQGFSMEYKRLDDGYFWFELSLPEHLEPFPDFLYFSVGVWSGSSRQANLQNDLRNVVVNSHRATAEILFDERSLKSKAAYNPIYSRWKTHIDLKASLKAEQEAIKILQKETSNLRKATAALTDCIFFIQKRESAAHPEDHVQALDPPPLPPQSSGICRLLPVWVTCPEASIQHLRESFDHNVQLREELEGQRDRMQSIFDAVSDVVLVYRSGKPVLMNQQATLLMKNLGENAEGLQDYILKHLDRGINGKPYPFSFGSPPSGIQLLLSSVEPLDLEEGKALLAVLLDLTPVQKLIQQLNEDEYHEKTRIRRDLHDGLSQCLTSLALQSKALSLMHSDEKCHVDLNQVFAQANRCVQLGSRIYKTLPEI